MKRPTFILNLTIGLILILPALSWSEEFITYKELQPGQKGYGLTVLQGDRPEKFEVEYVGVTDHPLFSKEKMILIKVGKPVGNSNIIAGMSGSPIYFKKNGEWRLLGALAFGLIKISGKDAIAGITPIQAMLSQEKTLGLTPIAHKLERSGKLNSGQIYIGDYADGFHIYLLQPRLNKLAAKNRGADSGESRLIVPQPGEAITVLLSDGDVQYGATGTVTYVKGKKFYAFGHPFLGGGKVAMPAYKSRIAVTLQGPGDPYKIPSRNENPFGYIYYDNVFGIDGEVTPLPKNALLPLKIHVVIGENGDSKEANFQFRVIKDRLYSEQIIGEVTDELLSGLWDAKNRATITANATISFKSQKPIQLFSSYSTGQILKLGPFVAIQDPWAMIDKATQVVDAIMNSEWNIQVRDITVDIHLRPGSKTLSLDSCKLLDQDGKPAEKLRLGERVYLLLGLRSPDGAQQFVISIPIEVPKDLKLKIMEEDADGGDTSSDSGEEKDKGSVQIYIESGNRFVERDENKLPTHDPDNPEEFLNAFILNQKDPSKLYIQVLLPQTEPSVPAVDSTALLNSDGWHKVENLNFLRDKKTAERKIVLLEINSPLPGYVLNVVNSFQVQLVIKKRK